MISDWKRMMRNCPYIYYIFAAVLSSIVRSRFLMARDVFGRVGSKNILLVHFGPLQVGCQDERPCRISEGLRLPISRGLLVIILELLVNIPGQRFQGSHQEAGARTKNPEVIGFSFKAVDWASIYRCWLDGKVLRAGLEDTTGRAISWPARLPPGHPATQLPRLSLGRRLDDTAAPRPASHMVRTSRPAFD
jgi:hypothetical protein